MDKKNDQNRQEAIIFVAAKERTTTNTIRYEELVAPDSAEAVGYLYIKKKALARIGNPGIIEVQIRKK